MEDVHRGRVWRKRGTDKGKMSLSYQLYEAVRDQAGKKGIAYTDGPAH